MGESPPIAFPSSIRVRRALFVGGPLRLSFQFSLRHWLNVGWVSCAPESSQMYAWCDSVGQECSRRAGRDAESTEAAAWRSSSRPCPEKDPGRVRGEPEDGCGAVESGHAGGGESVEAVFDRVELPERAEAALGLPAPLLGGAGGVLVRPVDCGVHRHRPLHGSREGVAYLDSDLDSYLDSDSDLDLFDQAGSGGTSTTTRGPPGTAPAPGRPPAGPGPGAGPPGGRGPRSPGRRRGVRRPSRSRSPGPRRPPGR